MRKFIYAAAAAALSFSATANAAPLVLSPTVVTSVTPPASGTFGNSFNPATLGLFTNNFVIDLTNSSLTNGSLISISFETSNNISFTCEGCSIRLDSTLFNVVSTGGLDVFTLSPMLLGMGQHTLSVTGNVVSGPTAAYSGTINFNTPVPEPGTWAMMLLGFGGVGLMMRRRRRPAPAFAQIA